MATPVYMKEMHLMLDSEEYLQYIEAVGVGFFLKD